MARFGGDAATFTREPPAGFDAENPTSNVVTAINMREHVVREKYVEIATSKVCLYFIIFAACLFLICK